MNTERGPRKPRPSECTTLERSRIRRVERFTGSGGAGSESLRLGFAAIKLADGIGANAPERLLVGLRFLAFAVSAFVRRADEAALDEHVRTFLDGRRDVFGEPRTEQTKASKARQILRLTGTLVASAANLIPI